MPDDDHVTLAGSCLCGGVRFAASGPPRFVAHCHCENCRKAHGAGIVTWIGLPSAAVDVTRGEEACARYVSDTGATWTFCRTCGSRLFYAPANDPAEIHVAAGALDVDLDAKVNVHVYADRATTWCPITDDLPQRGGPSA